MVEETQLDVTPTVADKSNHDIVNGPPGHHRLWRYGPLVLWAALIFIASTGLMSASNTSTILRPTLLWLFPNISEATLNLIHFMIRKAAHFSEYAILALLAARAFRTSSRELLSGHWFWISLLVVVVYSLTDEFHQGFVPSRTPSIYDSLIDSAGGFTAMVLVEIRQHRKPRPGLQD